MVKRNRGNGGARISSDSPANGARRSRAQGSASRSWFRALAKGDSTPSQGHAIDHIGFRPVNLEASVEAMKARNVKILTEPRPLKLSDGTMVQLAFAEGPDVVRIEMVQRPE